MTQSIPPQDDDSTVRHYRADGTLTVTRDEETNEHVIESRGQDQDDKWTRRVPATRTTVKPGEHLWSIPDNWTKIYRLQVGDSRKKEIHRIPESEDDVVLSLARNSTIGDAFHIVEKVGNITWTGHVEVDLDALDAALNCFDEYSEQFDDSVRDILEYIRDNPHEAVADAEELAETNAPECVEGSTPIPTSEFDPFEVMFRSSNEIVSHPEHGTESDVMDDVHELLGQFDVVPPSPVVSMTVQ